MTARWSGAGAARRLHARWRAGLGPVALALLLVASAAHCAQRSLGEAEALLAHLNIRAPRLAQLPAELATPLERTTSAARSAAAAPAAPLARRVVLLVIDGLGEEHSHGLPVLDELRRRGVSRVTRTHLPSLSRPNYVSLLTGVPPLHSGVRSNDYGWEVPLDSLLHRVRASGRRTAFVTDVSPGFGAMFGRQLSDATAAPWSGGLGRAAALALERRAPLVVIIAGAVDDAGHRYGAGEVGDAGGAYRRAALQIDRQLAELLRELDLTHDAIVVTADHGHTAGGGHGGDEPEVMRVPLVMAGAGIRSDLESRSDPDSASPPSIQLIDLAPTLAALLGVPAPRHALGHTLTSLLTLSAPRADALRAADARRLAALHTFLRAELAAEGRPLLDRLFASFALAILLLFLVLTAARQHLAHLDLRVVVGGLAAPLAAAAALLASSGGELSLSSLANRAEGTRAILCAAAAAAAAQLAFAWWALRRRPRSERLPAANAAALIALATAALLASAIAAFLGSPPWQRLPAAPWLLLMPLASTTLATSALGCALLLVLELVIFAARCQRD